MFFRLWFLTQSIFPGFGFGDKVCLSLAQVPNPGCVSFTGSGLRARYSGIGLGLWITDLLGPGSLIQIGRVSSFYFTSEIFL